MPDQIALNQGRMVRNVEAILERPDGTRIPIMPYPTPLYDGAGAIAGVVNMTVDISERKKAELVLACFIHEDVQEGMMGGDEAVGLA